MQGNIQVNTVIQDVDEQTGMVKVCVVKAYFGMKVF